MGEGCHGSEKGDGQSPSRPLTLYPAIDLKGGACVRLRQGAMDQATVYSTDPAAQARAWIDAGCRWLHVVDLDGAIVGSSVNAPAIAAILAAATVPVQLGGGLRDLATIAHWLEAGATRAILGSAAVKRPALVAEACRTFPGRIVIGIDARAEMVATEGWVETSAITALDLARRCEQWGVAAIIHTDIARDGMLTGANVAATAALAAALATPVIASGGIGCLDDLRTVANAAAALPRGQIEGVIVGRALYDGRIDIAAAMEALSRC